jgi:hypothetical protein
MVIKKLSVGRNFHPGLGENANLVSSREIDIVGKSLTIIIITKFDDLEPHRSKIATC